jgi:hypothetical protein
LYPGLVGVGLVMEEELTVPGFTKNCEDGTPSAVNVTVPQEVVPSFLTHTVICEVLQKVSETAKITAVLAVNIPLI